MASMSWSTNARLNDPEPPSVVFGQSVQINDIDLNNYPSNPAALFEPLWPPYSDYYLSTPDTFVEPQVYWNPDGAIGNESIPAGYINFQVSMPPMPIAESLYSGYVNKLGSALDVDPLFWRGVHSTLGGGAWNFFTIEMSHLPGRSNYHNRFQAMVDFDSAVVNGVGVAGWEWPPYWQPGGHGGNFTDWVDLYAPYLSRAYFEDILNSADSQHGRSPSFGRNGFPRIGSPQHVELPPNYPPRTTSVTRSTSPLIPASGGDSHGSYVIRETVADRVDMITGEPMLTEVDFELPFGSAVYRRVRTYSESAAHGIKNHRHDHAIDDIESTIRGWHGLGWMSSDAPLFLFDASYSGTLVTGDENDIGPVCYFAPDAHHSIPFIQQGGSESTSPDYVAPAWFDAMLLYDKSRTVWDPAVGWIRPPEEMKLYMHDNSVVYTIKMYYEDVDPLHHQRPALQEDGSRLDPDENSSHGVPYYGLVTSIEDSAGNRVEITYADPDLHKPYLDPAYNIEEHPIRDAALAAQVLPVLQRGWYKGMIDHVKLHAPGATQAAWSIYYTYRTFLAARNENELMLGATLRDEDDIEPFLDYWSSESHAPALHSILVYEGDVHPLSDRNLILPCDSESMGPEQWLGGVSSPHAFVDVVVDSGGDHDGDTIPRIHNTIAIPRRGSFPNQFKYQDVMIGPTGYGNTSVTVLSEDWAHQLRYSYADPAHYGEVDENDTQIYSEFNPYNDYTHPSCGPVEIDEHYLVNKRHQAAYLLKVESKSRTRVGEPEQVQLPSRYWLYRYQDAQEIITDRPSHWPSDGVDWEGPTNGQGDPNLIRRLTHRFGPETIARIYKNRPSTSAHSELNGFVNGMIGLDEDRILELASGSLDMNTPLNLAPATGPTSGNPFGQPVVSGAVPYEPVDPDDPSDPDAPHDDSTVHNMGESAIAGLPIGMLADSVFFRWTQAYRLDPRIGVDGATDELIARPASWEVLDGRVDGTVPNNASNLNEFNSDLREYVGGRFQRIASRISKRPSRRRGLTRPASCRVGWGYSLQSRMTEL
jgi:hypothetical protein